MATVKDIARLAGVSTATVSRALAEPEKVSEATRLKVEEVASKAGYSPNANARSLRTNATRTLVVIVPDIANSFFAEVVKGIETVAHKHRFTVLVADSSNDYSRALHYLELINSRQVDGALLLTTELPINNIVEKDGTPRFPIVMACEYYRGSNIPSVHVDNEYSARMVAESLLQMGHYKIATITGPMHNPICMDRLTGFKATLEKAQIDLPEHCVLNGDFSFQSGYQLANALLCRNDSPSAIFCHNDEMAIGVLKRARELSIPVPKLLSVVGFDNIVFSEYCTPELTTVHQPRQLIGETATKLLLDILAGKKPNPEMTLPTQFLLRASTASPPFDKQSIRTTI